MDLSRLKNLLKVSSIFREHSSLVVPIAVALAGVLLFLFTHFMSSKLKAQITRESITDRGRRIEYLSKDAIPAEQWKVEKQYQHKYATDANHVVLLARQLTERPLLQDMMFPQPKTRSTLIFEQFGQRYREGINELLSNVEAGNCPTITQLRAALESSPVASKLRWGAALTSPSATAAARRAAIAALLNTLKEVDRAMVDILCKDKAQSARVYASPADIGGYEFWEEYKYAGADEAIQDCWYYQLGYWIIEDVFQTIGAMNSASNNILTAPVKRLVRVGFTLGAAEDNTRRGPRRARYVRGKKVSTGERPAYIVTEYDGLTESWTGRRCNDDIDVVHFSVSVLVSANAVFPFMEQLCSAKEHTLRGASETDQKQTLKHNQITILESTIGSIDPEGEDHGLYRYGDDAIVALDLICEYIFNKTGYEDIKPDAVKQAIQEAREAKPFQRGAYRRM
jgi:hypothetical protein